MKAGNNFDIISYNCKGFKERNYDYLRNIFRRCDIMLVQETWLHLFQQSQIKDLQRDSDCHTVSSMKDNDILRMGRPYQCKIRE